MKFIAKGREPALLRKWRLGNKSTPQNLSYDNIPTAAKTELRSTLLAEQGRLCAYTMLRLSTVDEGHIEHLSPRSSPPPKLGVAYANMVYCYPGANAPRCAFGAHRKDDAGVSGATFLSPLDLTCERRFTFESGGQIRATDAHDDVAYKTIVLLGLDDKALQIARRAAMQQLPIYKRGPHAISSAQIRKLTDRTLQRDSSGDFTPFAVALFQTLRRFEQRQAAREAGARAKARG